MPGGTPFVAVVLAAVLSSAAQQDTTGQSQDAPRLPSSSHLFDQTEPQSAPQGVDVQRRTRSERLPLFGGWETTGSATWTDGRRFDAGITTARPDALAQPAWLSVTPSWTFTLRATHRGPGGVQFGARAGASRGSALPLFVTEIVGTDRIVPIKTESFDPVAYETSVHAGVEVERHFSLGHVDVRLFGEALAVTGHSPLNGQPTTVPSDKPAKPVGGAIRFGIGVGF